MQTQCTHAIVTR